MVAGILNEEIPDSGVYIYVMPETIHDLKLPEGIYLVYAQAILPSGEEAVDSIQFHIDPPGDLESTPWLTWVIIGLEGLFVIGMFVIKIFVWRNRNRITFR